MNLLAAERTLENEASFFKTFSCNIQIYYYKFISFKFVLIFFQQNHHIDNMKKTANSELGRATVEEYASIAKIPVIVVLDNVRSMNNVGSFFRTCDAFTAEAIVLCGITGTPPDREIHKTALGAENTVKWSYRKSTVEAVCELTADGYTPVAVEQVEGSTPLQKFICEKGKKYALIFGNEVSGVSQEAADLCETAIEIPQGGTKHSINVAVSGGIVLWHFYTSPWVG